MKGSPHRTKSPRHRLKVVLIAYGCEPKRGSEPGTGWNMALGLAEEHDVTVVTRANNRDVIERDLKEYEGTQPEFLYVDPPRWILALKKSGLLPVQVFYAIWQWVVARTLAARNPDEYDIIHQLTFNSFEVPPLAFLKSRAVKVWGPIGGGQTVPIGLLPCFGFLGGIKEGMRNLRVRLSAWSPVCRKILKTSDLVLFANGETRELLKGACRGRTEVMIDVGVNADQFSAVASDRPTDVMTFLFAGRLEGRKGVLLVAEAVARLAANRDDLRLRIAGDGPLKSALEGFVTEGDLSDRVDLVGLVDHPGMVEEFRKADVFVFPSLRDTSGTIVLEAMSMGLPVVCFDHQGAAIMVDDESGIKITARSRRAAVESLAEALASLLNDRQLARSIGRKARLKVRDRHDWSAKVRRISGYYRELLADRTELREGAEHGG